MLKSIDITNFALIESIHLNFKQGLNIIIGETGAGKSIIVDALLQALGDRGSSELVKDGANKCIIEAEFELPESHPAIKFLVDNEIDIINGSIITRREISAKGTSRCFINDSQVQVSALHAFGDLLADFHGQHEHQYLLKPENHLNILDDFAGINEIKAIFREKFLELNDMMDKHRILLNNERESTEKISSYQLELKELDRINPLPGEDVAIEEELIKIENSEILFKLTSELSNILVETESNVQSNLIQSKKILENLIHFDKAFEQYIEETQTAIISISEIINFVNDYKASISFDPERIEELRERIVLLKGLTKKYGALELSIERAAYLREQFEIIENYEEKLVSGRNEIIELKKETGKIADQISTVRKRAALKLEKSIIEQLNSLSLENSKFNVEIKQNITSKDTLLQNTVINGGQEYVCSQNGIDDVEFFISTNKGEQPKPLVNVASGGEISRLMLAIKSVIAETEKIPLLVFDEIDTGISGRIAGKVGQAMKDLSDKHQVIAITHLAQIAVQGSNVISVIKSDNGVRTVITAREETDSTKIREIAKLISSDNVTESSIRNVYELMNKNYQD